MTTKPGPMCHLCPLSGAPGPVWGIGSPNARLVRVDIAPTYEEIASNEPFSGKSGNLLESVSRKVGISRERSYTTNVVKCLVPPGQPLPQKAVDCCSPLIRQELEMLQFHDTILTLGGEAFHAFTHKKLLAQSPMRKGHKKPPDSSAWLRGCVYPVGDKRVIVPAVHPSYLLRTGFKDILFFERDLDRARRFAEGKGVRYDVHFNYTPTTHEVLAYVQECINADRFGLDIETTYVTTDEEESVAEDTHQITVVGLSAHKGECIGVAPDQLSLLAALFQRRDRRTRMYDFNHGFDGYHLGKRFNMDGVQPFDVMKAWYLIYPDAQRHDLATALSWFTDLPYHKNLQFAQPDLYNAYDTFGVLDAGIQAEKELKTL